MIHEVTDSKDDLQYLSELVVADDLSASKSDGLDVLWMVCFKH